MAGNGDRIYNFCKNHPGTPGCTVPRPVPRINPCVAAATRPLSIGTTKCNTYTVFIDGLPSPTNPNTRSVRQNYTISITPLVGGAPNPQYLGFTGTTVVKLFSDIALTNQIGEVLLSAVTVYDTPKLYDPITPANTPPPTGAASSGNVSTDATVFWFNPATDTQDLNYLRASLKSNFMYHLKTTDLGTGYPGSFVTKSINCGQQLSGKSLTIASSVVLRNTDSRPINKLVISGTAV